MSELTPIILECGGCTAPLSEAIVAKGVHKCPYCGYVNILPKEEQTSEVKHYLFSGDAELRDYEFERAYNAYAKAAELDSSEAKAYFGMALAKNKVKYVRDLVNNRWQAICCEVTDKKFSEDASFIRALGCATEEQKEEFASRAREIDYIREKFLELQNTGLDYDTFICVKVSDGEGGFTTDSHWAGKLYDNIKKAGMKPFYSEREIGDRVGEDYEALILYALHSSESMIIVCSNEDYLRTPWVQNEYTRYHSMLTGEEKAKNSIMIAFSGQVIERIPGISGKIQGVDLHSFDASQKINEFVSKFAHAEERARKRAEEKARAEAERKAEKEAERKAREKQEKAIEELQRKLEETASIKTDNRVKYCSDCGAENKIDVRYCYLCGKESFCETNEKFCTTCKERTTIATKVCKECGSTRFASTLEECERLIANREARKRANEERKAREEAYAEKNRLKGVPIGVAIVVLIASLLCGFLLGKYLWVIWVVASITSGIYIISITYAFVEDGVWTGGIIRLLIFIAVDIFAVAMMSLDGWIWVPFILFFLTGAILMFYAFWVIFDVGFFEEEAVPPFFIALAILAFSVIMLFMAGWFWMPLIVALIIGLVIVIVSFIFGVLEIALDELGTWVMILTGALICAGSILAMIFL